MYNTKEHKQVEDRERIVTLEELRAAIGQGREDLSLLRKKARNDLYSLLLYSESVHCLQSLQDIINMTAGATNLAECDFVVGELQAYLQKRWQGDGDQHPGIQNSNLSYCQNPPTVKAEPYADDARDIDNPYAIANRVCLQVARAIAPIITNRVRPQVARATKPTAKYHPYRLLMPSLEPVQHPECNLFKIDGVVPELNTVILSENNRWFIDVASNFLSIQYDSPPSYCGKAVEDGETFSQDERNRWLCYRHVGVEYNEFLERSKQLVLSAPTLEGDVKRLILGLRKGGAAEGARLRRRAEALLQAGNKAEHDELVASKEYNELGCQQTAGKHAEDAIEEFVTILNKLKAKDLGAYENLMLVQANKSIVLKRDHEYVTFGRLLGLLTGDSDYVKRPALAAAAAGEDDDGEDFSDCVQQLADGFEVLLDELPDSTHGSYVERCGLYQQQLLQELNLPEPRFTYDRQDSDPFFVKNILALNLSEDICATIFPDLQALTEFMQQHISEDARFSVACSLQLSVRRMLQSAARPDALRFFALLQIPDGQEIPFLPAGFRSISDYILKEVKTFAEVQSFLAAFAVSPNLTLLNQLSYDRTAAVVNAATNEQMTMLFNQVHDKVSIISFLGNCLLAKMGQAVTQYRQALDVKGSTFKALRANDDGGVSILRKRKNIVVSYTIDAMIALTHQHVAPLLCLEWIRSLVADTKKRCFLLGSSELFKHCEFSCELSRELPAAEKNKQQVEKLAGAELDFLSYQLEVELGKREQSSRLNDHKRYQEYVVRREQFGLK